MELSVDAQWVIFQICYDINEKLIQRLLPKIRKIQLNITPTDKSF